MGLKKLVLEKVAGAVVENVVEGSSGKIDRVLSKLEKNSTKQKEKEEKIESSFKRELILSEESSSRKKGYHVHDKENIKRYSIKINTPLLGRFSVYLYDRDKQEVGRIVEIRHYFSLSNKQYEVYLCQKRVGTIFKKLSLKEKLFVDYNGWNLQGTSFWRNGYEICNSNSERVAYIKGIFENNRYGVALQYDNPEVEIIGLLLFMTLELIDARLQRDSLKGVN